MARTRELARCDGRDACMLCGDGVGSGVRWVEKRIQARLGGVQLTVAEGRNPAFEVYRKSDLQSESAVWMVTRGIMLIS